MGDLEADGVPPLLCWEPTLGPSACCRWSLGASLSNWSHTSSAPSRDLEGSPRVPRTGDGNCHFPTAFDADATDREAGLTGSHKSSWLCEASTVQPILWVQRTQRTEVTEHVSACARGCCFLLPQSTPHPPTPWGGPYLLCSSWVHGWDGGGKLRRQGIHDETALPLSRIPSLSQSLDPSPTQTAPPPHSSLVIQSPPPDALHLRCHLPQEDSSIPKTSLCLTSHSASSPSPWAHLDRFIG